MSLRWTSSLAILCIFFGFCRNKCSAVSPYEYIPAIGDDVQPRESLIRRYFCLGFTYLEILVFLSKYHGIELSLRQLKRLLRRMRLYRRIESSPIPEVSQAVERELNGSGCSLGYRAMHQRLQIEHGLVASRETVRQILKILDPDGVERRKRHRLQRRQYRVKGPNYMWHIDGYDKLKPFGFCVHGAICGYSRRILWLEVGPSNNNPRIIARYFVNYVKQIRGTPRIIRADFGNENVFDAAMQRFFRSSSEDSFAGDKSFMYGKSTSNQRIEAWWSQLRKSNANWWIEYFKDLRDTGLFCDVNYIQQQCLKFCFMNIIQNELHRVVKHWNTHSIRPSTNTESPSGRPDILYFLPEVTNTRDYVTVVNNADIEVAEETCCLQNPVNGCEPEFNELAYIIMEERGLSMPTTVEEAQSLYLDLLENINDIN